MTPSKRIPFLRSLPPQRRLTAAAEWAQRFAEGSATQQSRQWQKWHSDPRNRAAFATARALRHALRQPEMRRILTSSLSADRPSHQPWRSFGGVGLVTGLACLLICPSQPDSIPWHVLKSSPDVVNRATLSDGSLMEIDSGSDVWTQATPAGPVVQLNRGETFVSAAEHHPHPVRVLARDLLIQDIGTQFSVRILSNGIRVAVLEGTVVIWPRTPGLLLAENPASAKPMLRIEADQVVTLTRDASQWLIETKTDQAEVKCDLAWRSGELCTSGLSVAEAVKVFNQHNQEQIIVLDPKEAQERFGGIFDLKRPHTFVKAMNLLYRQQVVRMSDDKHHPTPPDK